MFEHDSKDVEMAVPASNATGAGTGTGTGKKGLVLQWKDICYDVTIDDPENKGSKKTKTLIHQQSGEVHPGEMCAIMGSSGAGKSTLLDILAGRLVSNQLSGSIATNGKPIDASFRYESGYVMQSDALFPLLTVRETLRFAALLRIPDKTVAEKEEIVTKTIEALRLERAADTIVGDELHRGVSGGERRRVSIGVDTIHQPSVIFLDEPTSGLDSTTALSVVETIRAIAAQGKTIVVTVHQPSNKVFSAFDKVLFLAQGHVTYFGSVTKLSAHIAELCAKYDIPNQLNVNLPELYLEISDQVTQSGRLHSLLQDTSASADTRNPSTLGIQNTATFANDAFTETMILSRRVLMNIVRTKELFFARMGLAIFFGLIMGTLFLNSGQSDEGIQQRTGYLIFALAFFFFTSLEALPIFLNEREIFQREFSRGAYRAASYVIANSVVYMPFLAVVAVLFVAVSWFLVGMGPTAGPFFFMILITFVVLLVANAFVTLVAAIVSDPLAGNSMGSAIFANMFLFCGFFIKKPKIPAWWIWFYYLSLFKWSFDSMIVNALKQPYISDWNDKLSPWDLQDQSRWNGFGVLIAYYVVMRLGFYYLLVTKYTGQRRT